MQKTPKILIVDDTPQNIHVLMEALKDTYQIVAATSGPKALRLAEREPRPDLVLLDVMMPEMSGYEVCRHLKSDPETAKIPVIFVTALSETGDEEQGLQLGAVDFITKPFHPALVKARVRNHLELKRNRDELEDEVRRRTQELLDANLARQKLEQELEVARSLQLSMLPGFDFSPAEGEPAVIAAYLRPARAVGGDLFDYLTLPDGRILVVVGDVSDKGVVAALFMVRVLTLLRSWALRAPAPSRLLQEVNDLLCEDNEAFMFVTLSCLIIDLKTGAWSYASGGHEPPILSGADGARFVELESGPALGLVEEAEFPEHTGVLRAGERLLFYTDGLTEAENPDREFLGSERLRAKAEQLRLEPLGRLVSGLIEEVDGFSSGSEQSDDITLLGLELRGGAA